tara:strand:- start:532 stop:2343 length:1812 start_codon:yes stop_codon:yes gene_type:complete
MATLPVMFNQALSSFQAGQLEVATREIERALSSDPQNPDVLHLAALIAKSKYNYAKSEEYFRGSLECSAKQPVVLSNLANLLKTMGRFAEANKAYLAAIEILPSFRDAWLNRGLLAKEMLDWDEAKTCMTQALKIKQEPGTFSSLLQLYLETKDVESLVSQSKAFQREYPTLTDGYIYQAKGLVLKTDASGARTVLDEALSLVDDKARIEYELGLHHYDRDNFDVAENYLKQAIDRSPEFMDAHRSLNQLYFQIGNDNFLDSYSKALVKLPSSELLLHNLAANQASSGETDQAIDTLKHAINLIGKTAFLNHGLGALLVRKGELDKALPLFDFAIERDPANVRFILDRISLDIKMGVQDKSQVLINRALALQPYNQETWAYQGLVWRLKGDSKYDWLYDFDVFLRSYTLPVPQGFSSLSRFMEELSHYLSSLHVLTKQPLDQSVVQGTQTMGVLLEDPNPLVQAFKGSLMECVDGYLEELPNNGEHPFLSRLADGYAFSGSWSVKLKKSGHHSNHVHPFGWLSCCSYISIPDMSQSHAGWIKFGETSLNLGSRESVAKAIQPTAGKCVFFPSYFWHGTYPLESEDYRMTIPCDIDPIRSMGSR